MQLEVAKKAEFKLLGTV